MSLLQESFAENIGPLLDLVDRLRALGIQREISIPQIAVMGDQSSGKSSVLESITKIPFPRGIGLVTRCATQISMRTAPGSQWRAEISVRKLFVFNISVHDTYAC